MAVTPADVIVVATEFAAVATATIQFWIDWVEEITNRGEWGATKADKAVIYLTAHHLKLLEQQSSAAPGAVSSLKGLSQSVTYAVTAPAGDDELGTTAWGRRYKQLQRAVFVTRF